MRDPGSACTSTRTSRTFRSFPEPPLDGVWRAGYGVGFVPSAVLTQPGSLARHHPLGTSTGALVEQRGDWEALVCEAQRTSTFAVELAALSAGELPELLHFLSAAPALPFHFISLHAPSKGRRLREKQLVAMLLEVVRCVDAVVVHPDTIDDASRYAALGSALVLENMDSRKHGGRTAAELAAYFAALPQAGFCFDVAHAASVDETLAEGERLLDRFGARLRHVHVSSLDEDCHHVPLTAADEERFAPLLRRCRDVPWILEAPLREI